MQNNLQKDNGIYLVNTQPLSYDYMVTKYSAYKEGNILVDDLEKREKLEVETLKILEELGYSLEETGTYFYKDVIVKAVEKLQESSSDENYQELIAGLSNDFSQFYFDIARNGYDVGLKTFHGCINMSHETKNIQNTLLQQRIGIEDANRNYKQEALLIANYIMENQTRKELPQIKQKAMSY